jgi:hypothetical protein
MLLISIVVFACVYTVFVYPNMVKVTIDKHFEKYLKDLKVDKMGNALNDTIALIQEKMKCCGTNGRADYTDAGGQSHDEAEEFSIGVGCPKGQKADAGRFRGDPPTGRRRVGHGGPW